MANATSLTHFGRNAIRLGCFTPIALIALLILGFLISEGLKFNWVGASVMLMAVLLAPVAHLVGLLWGVLAINRPTDNKRYGLLGVLLNVGLIGFGLVVASYVVRNLNFPFK